MSFVWFVNCPVISYLRPRTRTDNHTDTQKNEQAVPLPVEKPVRLESLLPDDQTMTQEEEADGIDP